MTSAKGLSGLTVTSSEPRSVDLQNYGYMRGIGMLLLANETALPKVRMAGYGTRAVELYLYYQCPVFESRRGGVVLEERSSKMWSLLS